VDNIQIEISRAKPEHSEDIVSIFNKARAEMEYLPIIHTSAEVRNFFTSLVSSGKVVALKEDKVIAGFMLVADGWLYHLYIAPQFQEKGYGKRLLDYAKELNPEGIKLWVFEQNVDAIRFYEREGFVLEKKRDQRATTNEENLPDRRYGWKKR
jgi:putative acetyltransferase